MAKYASRFLFISLLLASSFSASLFMILESAEFYRDFYSADGIDFGLWAAILNEVFLVIMAAVWLPKFNAQGEKQFHPGNLLIKLLMLLLFINTVGGASLNVIKLNLEKLQQEENRISLLETLKREIEEGRTSMDAFIKQNQRMNTAITAKNLTEVNKELKALQLTKKSALSLWLDVLLLFILRFTVQLANITSIWLASWLFRQPLSSAGIFHPKAVHTLRREFKETLGLLKPSPNLEWADIESSEKKSTEDTDTNRMRPLANEVIPATGKNPPAKTYAKIAPEKRSGNNHANPPVPKKRPDAESERRDTNLVAIASDMPSVTSYAKNKESTALTHKMAGNVQNVPASNRQQLQTNDVESDPPPIDKAPPSETHSKIARLSDEVNKMWKTAAHQNTKKNFCDWLHLDLDLFTKITTGELSGVTSEEIHELHHRVKESFEAGMHS